MPDLQVNPLYSSVPSLTENDLLSPYQLLAFEENDIKFLPLSLLNLGGSSNWKALAYQVSNAATVEFLHLKTVQELTDLMLVVIRESVSSKLYVSLGNTWDQETATALDYYDVNILTGANTLQDANEYITLRADAHSEVDIDGIQRLRVDGSIAMNGAFLLIFYRGTIATPTFFVEEVPE